MAELAEETGGLIAMETVLEEQPPGSPSDTNRSRSSRPATPASEPVSVRPRPNGSSGGVV
jgi:hypothetical protein